MTVGVNNFDRLKEDALKWRPESAERVAWAQVFLSLLTQTRYIWTKDERVLSSMLGCHSNLWFLFGGEKMSYITVRWTYIAQ